MKKEPKDWVKEGRQVLEYFENQFKNPYRSTVKFTEWLESRGLFADGARILDMGCGMGETLVYMAKRFPQVRFSGLDLNSELIERGRETFKQLGINNVELLEGDLFHPNAELTSKFDGILSLQTLSWLPHYKEPLEAFAQLKPRWVALTSLFFDGYVNTKTEVTVDLDKPEVARTNYYNTYSLPECVSFLKHLGFSETIYAPFEIDIDLPRTNPSGVGTYTEQTKDERRLMISGPLLMNWYFILSSQS